MTHAYLTTDRYLLRTFCEADLPNLVDLDRQEGVMTFITNGKPSTTEDCRDKSLPTIFGYYQRYNQELGNWIVIDRSTNEFVGWFHLRPEKKDLENRKKLELGYRILPTYWGRGVATEISKALVAKAFQELGAEEVFARTMQGNLKSIRVLEKADLQFEKHHIEDDFPGDNKIAVRYSIRKTDWESPSAEQKIAVEEFLKALVQWAQQVPSVSCVLLVGSYARGNPKRNSDIDLVILSPDKEYFINNTEWVKSFGQARSIIREKWGVLTSVRVSYHSGLEVEFGLAHSRWAATDPIDSGTNKVVKDAAKILWDPEGILMRLLKL